MRQVLNEVSARRECPPQGQVKEPSWARRTAESLPWAKSKGRLSPY